MIADFDPVVKTTPELVFALDAAQDRRVDFFVRVWQNKDQVDVTGWAGCGDLVRRLVPDAEIPMSKAQAARLFGPRVQKILTSSLYVFWHDEIWKVNPQEVVA